MSDEPEPSPPGMIGEPPSARYPAIPTDSAEHAARFAREWMDVAETYVRRRMRELGLRRDRIGMPDAEHGIEHAAFHPHNRDGGGFAPDGRIIVDSGVLNPSLMDELGSEVGEAWRKSPLRRRVEAIVAHEYEEHRGGTHAYAVEHAPDTELPIGDHTRKLLEIIREGERRR